MKDTLNLTEQKMEKCVNALKNEFSTIRAGRANPAVLDKMQVDYYGVPTQINAMAAVSVAEARILVIQPWDASSIKAIERLFLQATSELLPQTTERLCVSYSLSLPRSAERSLPSR